MFGTTVLTLGILDGMPFTGTVDGNDDGSTLSVLVVRDLLSGIPGSDGARLGSLAGDGNDQKGASDGDKLGAITLMLGTSDDESSTGIVDGDNNGSTLMVYIVGDVLGNGAPDSAGAKLGATVGTGVE
jgi:hypothetical protein